MISIQNLHLAPLRPPKRFFLKSRVNTLHPSNIPVTQPSFTPSKWNLDDFFAPMAPNNKENNQNPFIPEGFNLLSEYARQLKSQSSVKN